MALLKIVKPISWALKGLHIKVETIQGSHLPGNTEVKCEGQVFKVAHPGYQPSAAHPVVKPGRPLAIKTNVLGIVLVCAN